MMETPKPKKRRWQHGRPRLEAQTVRNVVLRLRVNAAELAAIAEKANEMAHAVKPLASAWWPWSGA